jgi:phenylacetate-CoA ligase
MQRRFFDDQETRSAGDREDELVGRLPNLIALALSAPGWAAQLAGVEPNAVTSRAALAQLPVLRKSDLPALRKAMPPFGGFNVVAPGQMRRLLMFSGPIFEPQCGGKDCWGVARALFAAGFRPGDIVHNSFAYHRSFFGFMMESGAHALGCAVIAAGTDDAVRQVEAIAQFRPSGFVGPAEVLKLLVRSAARAKTDVSSLKRALVCGAPLTSVLREEFAERGIAVSECYATADVGVVAYESPSCDGLVVNEGLLVEIVRPGTGDPVAEGETGEIVVTSFNPDYPMIRLATGDLSAVLKGKSPCGRTNTRLRAIIGSA